jgi:hypothetical protein
MANQFSAAFHVPVSDCAKVTLDLRDNPLSIPPEILEKLNPRSIIDYYFDHVKKPLNEIKLLFVGQGSVGKTSLIQKVLYNIFDNNQVKTEGISINQWIINDQVQSGNHEPEETNRIKSFLGFTLSKSEPKPIQTPDSQKPSVTIMMRHLYPII